MIRFPHDEAANKADLFHSLARLAERFRQRQSNPNPDAAREVVSERVALRNPDEGGEEVGDRESRPPVQTPEPNGD